MFGICNLSIIPLRAEPSDKAEIVSQVLFGEHFEILESDRQWVKIQMQFDQYTGWVDNKQFIRINTNDFNALSEEIPLLCLDLVNYVSNKNNDLLAIVLGSSLNFIKNQTINNSEYIFEGSQSAEVRSKNNIVNTSLQYLNTPYLWGGKTPFGIDCSGFTQMVYKLCGYKLLRDASQQSSQGEALSFIEESEPGDLAFFDNADGNIIHVGIIMENNYIIHASGKVRIDRLDHSGIYNVDTHKHTHQLRVIKKII